MPFMLVVAGPNGAGKTTYARQLALRAPAARFVNADEIARELPESSGRDVRAARDMIALLESLVSAQSDVILETTLATRRYLTAFPRWRSLGYEIELHYLKLLDPEAAIARVRRRVDAGGHNIPEDAVRRRFQRSLEYLEEYKLLADTWYLFNSVEGSFEFVLGGGRNEPETDGH